MDGMAFLEQVRAKVGEVPFIMLTAFAIVEKALAYDRLKAENTALRRQLEQGRPRKSSARAWPFESTA